MQKAPNSKPISICEQGPRHGLASPAEPVSVRWRLLLDSSENFAGEVLVGGGAEILVGHDSGEDRLVSLHPIDEQLIQYTIEIG